MVALDLSCGGTFLELLTCLDTSTSGGFGALVSAAFFFIFFVGFKVALNDDALLNATFINSIVVAILWQGGVVGFGVLLFWGIFLMIVGGSHIIGRS